MTDAPPPDTDVAPPAKAGLSRNARIGIAIAGVLFLAIVFGSVIDGSGSKKTSSNAGSATSSAVATSTRSAVDIQQAQAAQAARAARMDRSTYKELTPREFALLVKDPDAHKGEYVAIYGQVTQFDAATGTDAFRANTGPLPPDSGERYSQNSLVTVDDPATVTDVVEDDYLKMYVGVVGAHTYKTQMGGENTVPLFDLFIVDNLTREHEQRNAGN